MSLSMRPLFLFLSLILYLNTSNQAHAEEQPRLAVIPYLTLHLTIEEERELREVLSLEIASNTVARVLSSNEVKKKLPPIPDGCPEDPTCVASIGTSLEADYLLFVALIKNDTTIDMQLFLVEVAGAGAMRQEMTILQTDSAWSEPIGRGVRSLLGGVKRLAKETALIPITSQPTTIFIEKTPPKKDRKAWPWLLLGGVLLSGAAVGTVAVLYPFTSLGAFGPGTNQ
jgi:hypothetical protein